MCKRVLKETENKGVDVVFDAVGGEIFPSALDWYYNILYININYFIKNIVSLHGFHFSVGHEGKVVVAGFTSLQLPQLNVNELLSRPSFSLIGVSLNNYRTHSIKIYR